LSHKKVTANLKAEEDKVAAHLKVGGQQGTNADNEIVTAHQKAEVTRINDTQQMDSDVKRKKVAANLKAEADKVAAHPKAGEQDKVKDMQQNNTEQMDTDVEGNSDDNYT